MAAMWPDPAGDTVLCAVSGTDRDAVLIGVAGAFAHRAELALEVIHVHLPLEVTAVGMGALAHPPLATGPPVAREDVRPRLRALASEAGHDGAVCEAVDGPLRPILDARSRRPGIAWLVIGDHGGGLLRGALEGSVTRLLLADPGCPLIVVPPGADAGAIDDPHAVVCAVGDDEDEATTTALVAASVAGHLGAELTVVHAVDAAEEPRDVPAEEAERLLDRCMAMVPAGVHAHVVAAAGPPADALLGVLHDERAGIVVMGCPSHGVLRSALSGSVPHALLARMEREIAVVVPRRRADRRSADSPDP